MGIGPAEKRERPEMTTATLKIIDRNNRPGEVALNGFEIVHDFVPAGSEKQTKWALDIIDAALRATITDHIKRQHKTQYPESGGTMPSFLTLDAAEKLTADANRSLEQWFSVMADKPAKFFIDAKMRGEASAGQLYAAASK